MVANKKDVVNERPFKVKEAIPIPHSIVVSNALAYIYKYMYINCNELAKEESVTKSNMKVSGIKITYRSKMIPKVKKQIENIITYKHSTIQSCLFMHLIFLPFQTGSVN